MKHIIFKVLFAILTAMSPPVHAQERPDWLENCKLEHLAEVPMTMKSGHVTISASVNGKVVTLGIDTGGPFTSLTPATAHRVGNVGHRDNLQIGNVKLDGTYTGWMEAFPGVDGLIAPDILSKYDVEFDFGANIFGLFTPHSCANRVGNSTGTYTVIPFTLTRDEHVRVPVTLDGQNMYAILDTGAPISALSMQDARRMFDIDPDSASLKAAGAVSGLWSSHLLAPYTLGIWNTPSKMARAYAYPFRTMTMGELPVTDPPIELIQGRNFLGRDSAILLLGNDVLSHFHFIIAYREQKLYITDAEAR